jgi:hypothetical protein
MSDVRKSGNNSPPHGDANQNPTPEEARAHGATATAPANNQPTTPTGPTGVSSTLNSTGAGPMEDPKAKYRFWIIIAGLGSVVILYIGTIITFAILTSSDTLANNVVAAMGAITGVIGSLVGAYFGLQAGAAGKEASDAKAQQQSALASAAMGQLDSDKSQTAIQNAQQILQTGSPRSRTGAL